MTDPTYGPALVGTSPAPPPYWPHAQQPFPAKTSVAAWGIPTPVRRTRVLSWVIGTLLVLLVVTGIGVVLLLQDASPGVVANPPSQGEPGDGDDAPVRDPREVPGPPIDCLVECNEPDAPGGPEDPDSAGINYAGSDDAAVGFVQAIADGDTRSAHSTLCGVGKTRFPTPQELVADFYATLGFNTITGVRLTDVYAADSTADAVVFELQIDAGAVLVEVYIVEEASALTVCGYEVT